MVFVFFLLQINKKFYWPLTSIKRKGPFQSRRGKKSATATPQLPTPPPELESLEVVSYPPATSPAPRSEATKPPTTPDAPSDQPTAPQVPYNQSLNTSPSQSSAKHSTISANTVINLATPPPTPLAPKVKPKQVARRKHKGWVYENEIEVQSGTSKEQTLPTKRQRKVTRLFDL